MKFGIIKERKNPPDRRVVFSPSKLQELKKQFPQAEIIVESSDIRVFPDKAYEDAGFTVTNDDFCRCKVEKQVLNNPVMDRANRLCKMEASNGRRTFGTENERNR